ncbi:energy transducer TonB [Sphingomonas sp. KR3-1]|uniref:energy transducer TonB n=1 Tax=Sphingomonas sp. KR3-1 TaxID=3156611 RepID=UPI0032B416A3
MLLVSLLALAIQAVPAAQDKVVLGTARKPIPRNRPQAWITDDDYPRAALHNKQYGPVGFRLDVDANGHVTGCHVTRSSGYAELDDTACLFLGKRAEFTPAQDGAGKNIPFAYNGTFTWALPNVARGPNPVSALAADPVNVDIALQAVPKTYANPALLRLEFEGEKVKACHVETSSGNAKLDAVACEQTRAQVPPLKIGKPGIAEPDSRMALVTFAAAK